MEVRRQQTSGSGGESAQGSSTAALNLLMGGTVLRTGAGNREVQHLKRSFLLTGGSLLMEGGCGQDWPPHNQMTWLMLDSLLRSGDTASVRGRVLAAPLKLGTKPAISSGFRSI